MNPFDFVGPDFLYFYTFFGLFIIGLLWLLRRSGGSATAVLGGAAGLSCDPYLIAFLRGGREEAIRITTLSLLDRGFLCVPGLVHGSLPDPDAQFTAVAAANPGLLKRPLEQAIFASALGPVSISSLVKNMRASDLFEFFESTLAQKGLLPDARQNAAHTVYLVTAMTILLGVGAYKVLLGIQRGRPVTFLLILMAVFSAILPKVMRPRTTRGGETALKDLQSLFSSLRARAAGLAPGGKTNEVVLLAAVFGLAAVPTGTFPFATALIPPKRATSSGSWSFGSSSCGSGCGGGGCGGGCGGCGG